MLSAANIEHGLTLALIALLSMLVLIMIGLILVSLFF